MASRSVSGFVLDTCALDQGLRLISVEFVQLVHNCKRMSIVLCTLYVTLALLCNFGVGLALFDVVNVG